MGNNIIHEKLRIPDKIDKCLNLYYNKYNELEKVKINNLEVNYGLFLCNLPIFNLPDNLVINGYLNLISTPIVNLPNNLQIHGNLDLSDTLVKKLSNDLYVRGNVYLTPKSFLYKVKDKDIRKMCKNIQGEIIRQG